MTVKAQDRNNGRVCSPSVPEAIKNGGSVFLREEIVSHKEAPISFRKLFPMGPVHLQL